MHSVVIVSRRENHARHVAQTLDQVEARAARHLHVEQHELRRARFDRGLGFVDRACFSNYVHPREIGEQSS